VWVPRWSPRWGARAFGEIDDLEVLGLFSILTVWRRVGGVKLRGLDWELWGVGLDLRAVDK
jgi:hypothetical protein